VVQLTGGAPGAASAPTSAASPRKLLVEARRRGWLVALAVALAAVAAWGAGQALSRDHSAEAVLAVRVGGPLAAQPDASTKLAATYATLIPLDSTVQSAVDRALPVGRPTSFTMTNDANTAVLRIDYKASTGQQAIAGANTVARTIAADLPPSRSIAPGSLGIVRLAHSATRSGGTPVQLAIVGGALGLLLGLVLVAFWRSRDARIDDVRELRRQLLCPCFEVDGRSGAGARSLVEALASSGSRTAVVLPCRRRDERAAGVLRATLSPVLGEERALRAAPPGSDEAGELVAAAADATVLVVVPGVRVAEVAEAVDVLARYGASPAYCVLAGKRRSGGPPEIALTAPAADGSSSPAS
jgi:hypothetical protein